MLYVGNQKYKTYNGSQQSKFMVEKPVLPYDEEIEYIENNRLFGNMDNSDFILGHDK